MSEVGSLTVRIGGDTSGLEGSLRNADRSVKGFASQAQAAAVQIAKIGAAATAAGVAIVAGLAKSGMSAVDSQAKLSRQLGGTIDGLRGIQIAAKDAGVSGSAMEIAMERLNARLGEAQRGTGTAAEALRRLGLDADELSRMDIDQRMATIADRMKDLGLSSQQAGDELRQLGIRNGEVINLMMDGGDAIRAARQEVDDFGLSVSEVDAAQIEAANDAMSRIGRVIEVVKNQLAIVIGPVLGALADRFNEAARASSGWREEIRHAVETAVRWFAKFADVIEGVRRAFLLVGQGAAVFALTFIRDMNSAAASVIEGPIKAVNLLIDAFNKIPGIDIERFDMPEMSQGMRKRVEEMTLAVEEGRMAMEETLLAPMPSGGILEFLDDVRARAKEAAEEVVASRKDFSFGGGEYEGESDEDKKKAEQHRKQIADRLERIQQANMEEVELLNNKFALENETLIEALEHRLLTEQEYNDLMRAQKERHEAEITKIEQNAADARLRLHEQELRSRQATTGQILGNISTLMNTESRKMFEIGKAAGISNSIISTYTGMTKALELGWPLGPIAAAAIGAQGFAQVASISSQSFKGGGGASGSATAAVNNASTPINPGGGTGGGQQTIVNLSGDTFGRQQVIDLIESLNEASADGARIMVA